MQQHKQSLDSGVDMRQPPAISPFPGDRRGSVQTVMSRGYVPFAVGRHDVSVSVAGGPMDPRLIEKPAKRMTMMQYQTFVHATAAYKRQIEAMARATEMFVRQLQEVADCVPQAHVQDPMLVADLDFLIDSSQLLVNAHQTWAMNLEKEVEEPLMAGLNEIPKMAKAKQDQNKQQMDLYIKQLHQEEETSYKMKKKKTRDLSELQQSLEVRMALAEEIKRLSVENDVITDVLAQEHVPFVLQVLSKAVEAKLESFETIQEGFHKIGTQIDVKQENYRNRNPFFKAPNTEILPGNGNGDKQMNMDFLKRALENF